MNERHVIVGGGIYGTYVAWELSKRGEDVLLIERSQVAAGASGGPGKRGVRAGGRDPRELPLARIAYDLWADLEAELGTSIGYERVGQLEFIERDLPEIGPTSLQSAAARAWLQEQHDVPTEVLSAEDAAEMEPAVSDQVVGAIHTPRDGVVDHTAATRGIANAVRDEGGTIREGVSLAGLDVDAATGRVSELHTADGSAIQVGGHVLLLTNAHAAGFVREQLDATLPVWNFTPQVILTEAMDSIPFAHLIAHASRTLAMKGLADGRVMITGGFPARWDDERATGEPVQQEVTQNVEQATAVFPFVDDVAVDEVVADHRESCSIDGIPVIDTLPAAKNLIVGTGWTGHGYAIAPAVSQLLAEWVHTGKRPALLRPFGLHRFEPTA